jgi:hypothetical protein
LSSTPEQAQQEADVREMYEHNPSPGLKELIDESVSDNALLGLLDDETTAKFATQLSGKEPATDVGVGKSSEEGSADAV